MIIDLALSNPPIRMGYEIIQQRVKNIPDKYVADITGVGKLWLNHVPYFKI